MLVALLPLLYHDELPRYNDPEGEATIRWLDRGSAEPHPENKDGRLSKSAQKRESELAKQKLLHIFPEVGEVVRGRPRKDRPVARRLGARTSFSYEFDQPAWLWRAQGTPEFIIQSYCIHAFAEVEKVAIKRRHRRTRRSD